MGKQDLHVHGHKPNERLPRPDSREGLIMYRRVPAIREAAALVAMAEEHASPQSTRTKLGTIAGRPLFERATLSYNGAPVVPIQPPTPVVEPAPTIERVGGHTVLKHEFLDVFGKKLEVLPVSPQVGKRALRDVSMSTEPLSPARPYDPEGFLNDEPVPVSPFESVGQPADVADDRLRGARSMIDDIFESNTDAFMSKVEV